MVFDVGRRRVITSLRVARVYGVRRRQWTWELVPRVGVLRLGNCYSVKVGLGPWVVSFTWAVITKGYKERPR